jgi:multidrug efflux pump subunit AcrA (membrane-fusion protein)
LLLLGLTEVRGADSIEWYGTLVPARRVALASAAPGRVAEVNVRVGQRVKKGEILVRMESRKLVGELRRVEARIKDAGKVTDVLRAELMLAKLALDETAILAPFDGIVLAANVEPGEFTNPLNAGLAQSASVCELADTSRTEVEMSVPIQQALRLKPGLPCEVRRTGEKTPLKGVIHRIAPLAVKGEIRCWVQLPNLDGDAKSPLIFNTKVAVRILAD